MKIGRQEPTFSVIGKYDSSIGPEVVEMFEEYWSGLPCPPPGDLPDPGVEPGSPALQADSLPLSHQETLESSSTAY